MGIAAGMNCIIASHYLLLAPSIFLLKKMELLLMMYYGPSPAPNKCFVTGKTQVLKQSRVLHEREDLRKDSLGLQVVYLKGTVSSFSFFRFRD